MSHARSGPVAAEVGLAFEDFFERERRRLFRALYLMTGSVAEAEELTQDAFLNVWERWDRVHAMENPTGYLYRTAINGAHSRYRRAVRGAKLALTGRPTDDEFEAADLRDEVERALRDLPPRQRAALVLTELLEMTSEEAAAHLGVRPSTVRNLAAQGRSKLKEAMTRE